MGQDRRQQGNGLNEEQDNSFYQKNGGTPLANTNNSGYQLRGVSPFDMSIADLVKDV